MSTGEKSTIDWWCGGGGNCSLRFYKLDSSHFSSSVDSEDTDTASSVSDLNHLNILAILQWRYPHHFGPLPRRNARNLRNNIQEIEGGNESPSVPSTDTKQIRMIYSQWLNEARQVKAAMESVEIYTKIVDEEKIKHLEAVKEIEMAREQLAKEIHERQIAERKALEDSLEKKKIIDALILNDKRYKRYTRDEIEIATDSFSEIKMIGEGSYGKVYRCDLDKIPVAVKVLHYDSLEKKEEFLTEEVMEDPYIAADGYTYEHRAIQTWLERYPLSPVTKDRLPHTGLIQDHTLRSAIQEWRSCITPSSWLQHISLVSLDYKLMC
ncbi:hypothetical protein Vadar_024755 [Vaccinium darrowii]|uniref:Uncharacterized protein n=1 Tax=Vaccinium darrowii TaxID=229202 RepID=A0ACB7YH08_9ERIC|nr:hypothetical protein Vadar_024755 [Vaccinium darrowii]